MGLVVSGELWMLSVLGSSPAQCPGDLGLEVTSGPPSFPRCLSCGKAIASEDLGAGIYEVWS